MKYDFGEPKNLDSITKEDVIENKVWIWTWEADLEEEFDEDWQVPVIGMENIENEFAEPIITLKISETDIIASGSYDNNEKKIFGIAIWENNSWELITDSSLSEPIKFESLVKICGKEKTEFIMTEKNNDEAFLKK